jgi:hypothetical protein
MVADTTVLYRSAGPVRGHRGVAGTAGGWDDGGGGSNDMTTGCGRGWLDTARSRLERVLNRRRRRPAT